MATDIIFENGDVVFENGDFKVGYSDNQHIDCIIRSNPGDVKSAPLMGVGVGNYLHAPLSPSIVQRIKRDIQLHLESDGAKNVSVSWTDELNVSAEYEG